MNRRILGSLGLALWALAAIACASAPPGGGAESTPPGGAESSTPPGGAEGSTPPGGAEGSTPPGGAESTPPQGGGPSAGGADTACQADADCVIIETACCDHCNGGKAEAYNKAHADKHRPQGCNNVACTMRACAQPVAVCANNTCKAETK